MLSDFNGTKRHHRDLVGQVGSLRSACVLTLAAQLEKRDGGVGFYNK
jgi:hypothetical protein